MKRGNDKLTISVDSRVKALFKEVCDKEGLKVGKQIELFMSNELKSRGVDAAASIAEKKDAKKEGYGKPKSVERE